MYAARWILSASLTALLLMSGCATELEAPPSLARTRQALVLTLQPGAEGKDSRIFSHPEHADEPAGNHGYLEALSWMWDGRPASQRGLIDFDLSPLPPGSILAKATLHLSADPTHWTGGHSGVNALRVASILSPWDEASVTWNNQPSIEHRLADLLLPSTSPDQDYQIDITDRIARELAQPDAYHGFILELMTEEPYRSVVFASSDHPNPRLHPKLVLEYDTSPPPPGRIFGMVFAGQVGTRLGGVTIDAGNGHTTTTDDAGLFSLEHLPLGTYTLRASQRGWAFGSPGFQDANYTVTLTESDPSETVVIFGWDRDPIVFVHGWNSNRFEFDGIPRAFREAGYFTVERDLDTTLLRTPLFHVNARRVKNWIDEALFVTGRDQAILYAQSMGGLVSRAYVEGPDYEGDVSRLFTHGSPHLGTPVPLSLGCVPPRPDAVCEMTPLGMALFNLTHFKRREVDYHLTAGNSPMWTVARKCIRVFRRNICVNIPWPDTDFRNGRGWAMGALIQGPDDGFINTSSASGLPGLDIDRFITREVHWGGGDRGLGPRDYHEWNGGNSREAFERCSRRVLIERNTRTCGTRAWPGPPPGAFEPRLRGLTDSADSPATTPALAQLSRLEQGRLQRGEVRSRLLSVEGGPTTFAASWEEGSVRVTLVDPTGKVIDPEYAASLEVDPETSEVEDVDRPEPDAVVYLGSPAGAQYYFPAARAGTWELRLEGGEDIADTGTSFTAAASFDSPLTATFSTDRQFYAQGATARLGLSFSEAVEDADVRVTVHRSDGTTDSLVLERMGETEYAARYELAPVGGYVALDWALSGRRAEGRRFERGGRAFIQVHSNALRLGRVLGDVAIAREDVPGLSSALAVTLEVLSSYESEEESLGVSAELVAADGRVIARAVTVVPARLGANAVELRFRGEDIHRSLADGPYTVRNVRLLDQREALLLSGEVELAHTTAAYSYRRFAPRAGAPTVLLDGSYRVAAGDSLLLTATAIDPEGDSLTHEWDLDGDGVFDISGESVTLTTSPDAPAGMRTVSVRVTDTQGHASVATSEVEIYLDADGDGVLDDVDVCVLIPDPGQEDFDGDGQGDVCDPDDDGDGHADTRDNCPGVFNADQADGDGNGRGDACDPLSVWRPASALSNGRILHSATELKDGRLLVVGGYNGTTEVYEPVTDTWALHGNTLTGHRYHTATRLHDGRVLVAGGQGAHADASAEVYEPASGTWSATGNLVTYRSHHAATLLSDGRVLVMGGMEGDGRVLASAEVYEPATGTWKATGRMLQARHSFTATLLADGTVLVVGGRNEGRLNSAEVYTPATGTWTPVGNLERGRSWHTATRLVDGRVLVAGGAEDGFPSSTAELYEPATRSWRAAGAMNNPRRLHTATLLRDGRLLVTGGYDDSTGIQTFAETYEPTSGTWRPLMSMGVDRYGHTANLLSDGRVLAVGGFSNTGQSTAESLR
ncbi:kelch repeat-containing protein [Archangium violaceum]|uniref:kelch repeat-containing protein n=1 Tax=Archangium violaceum TaxID=83451 RepID=UPI0013622674|nr:kelch repeat-containing protein [Archangium violaceum]